MIKEAEVADLKEALYPPTYLHAHALVSPLAGEDGLAAFPNQRAESWNGDSDKQT